MKQYSLPNNWFNTFQNCRLNLLDKNTKKQPPGHCRFNFLSTFLINIISYKEIQGIYGNISIQILTKSGKISTCFQTKSYVISTKNMFLFHSIHRSNHPSKEYHRHRPNFYPCHNQRPWDFLHVPYFSQILFHMTCNKAHLTVLRCNYLFL